LPFGFPLGLECAGDQLTRLPVQPAAIAWLTAPNDGFGEPSGYSRPDCQPPEVAETSRLLSSTRWKKRTSAIDGSHEYSWTTRA
jgi:hypothetical protein